MITSVQRTLNPSYILTRKTHIHKQKENKHVTELC